MWRCEFVMVVCRCEFYENKQHSLDGISRLFISLNLMLASCQAPVLELMYWRWGALTIIAINMYLDTSHWSLVSLNRYTSFYFDFSGNTEKASSLMASKLIFEQSAEPKTAMGSTLIQCVIIFSSLPYNWIKISFTLIIFSYEHIISTIILILSFTKTIFFTKSLELSATCLSK